MTTEYFINPLDYAQGREGKALKHSFLQTERMLAGLNCLQPGQSQHLHDHPDQDKFYFVLAGAGDFTVGEASRICASGTLVLAPAGVPHGVANNGPELLSFLTVIAPFPQ